MRILILLWLLTLAVAADTPKRGMILVFDQMRADYIDRFDLKNFKRAQSMGLNFPQARVGHLESNTIISHPVITSGKFPKNLPWGVQLFRDVHGRLGPAGEYHMPARIPTQGWLSLLDQVVGDCSIVARIEAQREGSTFAVAQKEYAAYTFGGPYVDHIIALGSVFKKGPYKGAHTIAGENVPDYIKEPVGGRFYVEGVNRWDSELEGYGMKGSGYFTGTDPKRPGGDAWVGDAVEAVMQKEQDWSLILASFGAIDKVAHVLAEHDEPTQKPWALKHGINLRDTLQKADHELGRILDRLEETGLMQETALIITADHGGQYSRHFHGRRTPDRHRFDGYYGRGRNFDWTTDTPPFLKELVATGHLEAASMNTMLSFWTAEMNPKERLEFVNAITRIEGVAEVYEKVEGEYLRRYQSPLVTGRQEEWSKLNHRDLVATLAGETGPDYLALAFDQHGYAIIGGHGGAQEMVQRIPMIVLAPNLKVKGVESQAPVRLVDVNPMLGRLMGLPKDSRLDGGAEALSPFIQEL